MRKPTVAIAFAAGLLGGVASRYLSPQPVRADSIPKEMRAQSFILVDERGNVLGTLREESAGRPVLELFDAKGAQIWSAGGKVIAPTVALGK